MKLVVLFVNIGSYHLARLKAIQQLAQQEDFEFCAVQLTDSTLEHPWGDLEDLNALKIHTLLPHHSPNYSDQAVFSKTTANLIVLFLDKYQPDIIVIPGWGFKFSLAALSWCQKNKRKSILMSESKESDEKRWFWKEWIKSRIIKQFNSALVGGKLHKDYLIRLGMKANQIFLGYDVVDNYYFKNRVQYALSNAEQLRQDYPQIPSNLYFISLTRFLPRKNLYSLLQAYAKYKSEVGEEQLWHLVICGSGTEEEVLKEYVQLHLLTEQVHFPGFLPYQDIPYWYSFAGALIHPALQEQWGLVVNEAMASGLPVLVSNRCGCFPELVKEEVTGFGFDPENINELSNLMVKVSTDQVNHVAMGKAAQEHIANFSPKHFAQGLKSAIEVALEDRG